MADLHAERRRLAARLEQAERARAEVEREAGAGLDAIAADEALKSITAAEALKRRDAAEERRRKARERVDVLERALPEIDRRIEAEETAEHEANVSAARDEWERLLELRNATAAELAEALKAPTRLAEKLTKEREAAEALRKRVVELLDSHGELPDNSDEPDWGLISPLRELLVEGPLQPARGDAAARQEQAAARAQQDAEVLAWFRRHASERNLQSLPPHLHEQAREILTEVTEAVRVHRARQEEQARSREAVRLR